MTQIYEGMFLLDNQVVREDWKTAKAMVTDTLTKHGANVLTARRWDERKLAYPIQRKNRATFLLTYYEIPREGIAPMLRDFNLNERILRYLNVSVDGVPEAETALAETENSADFEVPPPPPDDAPDPDEGLVRSYDDEDEDYDDDGDGRGRGRGRRRPMGDDLEDSVVLKKTEIARVPASADNTGGVPSQED